MTRDRISSFAFRLAQTRTAPESAAPKPQWRPRDGIAIAGCTDPQGDGVLREAFPWGDGRAYC